MRLQKTYSPWEYVCQYRETHFDFLSRWMEKYGIYYFFEHSDEASKLVITDSRMVHLPTPDHNVFQYREVSGLDAEHIEEVFYSFFCQQNVVPRKVMLKDYNFEKPSLKVDGEAEVNPKGQGMVYLYGTHFKTPEEGNDLAGIMAGDYKCREKQFLGSSMIPYLRPGYLFTLNDHFRSGYNQEYLLVDLRHEGSQTSELSGYGLDRLLGKPRKKPFYRNRCLAIPQNVQFRPRAVTPKSRFYGTLHAVVDAGQSGQYAELDEHGRYKVILPFDLTGRKDGKASAWIRMMQPYAGSDHGMHLPLHKGTEVLLIFIDGDPDRPVIAGAVSNPETPSVVTSSNSTQSRITTSGGNKIHMEDQDGNQRILMHSPTSNSFVRIGSPNDPDTDDMILDTSKLSDAADTVGDGIESGADGVSDAYESLSNGIRIFSIGNLDVKVQDDSEFILGMKSSTVIGRNSSTVLGLNSDYVLGWDTKLNWGSRTDVKLATEYEYDTFKAYLASFKTSIKDMATKVVNAKTVVTDAAAYVYNTTTGLFVDRMMAVEEEIVIKADETEITAEETKIIEEINQIAAEINEILGSVNSIVAEKTEVIADQTDVVSERTSVVASDAKVAESESKVVSSSSEVNTSKTIVASSVSIV